MLTLDLSDWLAGFEGSFPDLYLVGGAVRDLLLGGAPKDIDLVCKDAGSFARSLANGRDVAVVPMEKKPGEPCYRLVDRRNGSRFIDIAELRGESIGEDLQRRDFTMNAVAVEVLPNGRLGAVIDPAAGREDIARRAIKTVSRSSIESDPLRILRAFRFAARLRFSIDESTREQMKAGGGLLARVPPERIVSELLLILESPQGSGFIRQMDEMGVLEVIFPEIRPSKGCTQNSYHHRDVWGHSLTVMENCEYILNHLAEFFGDLADTVAHALGGESRLPLLKLSALLHDVGKPSTRGINPETGRITFYGHDEAGAEIVAGIAERLKMSSHDRDYMWLLVYEHLNVLNLSKPGVKASAVSRLFRKLKDDGIPVIILGMSDMKGTLGPDSDAGATAAHMDWSRAAVRQYFEVLKKQLEREDLITGKDLIALGMQPGPELGHILKAIRKARDEGEIATREDALNLARKLSGQLPSLRW